MRLKRFLRPFVIVSALSVIVIFLSGCTKQPLPKKIGFHVAKYDRERLLSPWTSWEDAIKREMDWYYKAPIGKSGFPVYFYSTFIDSAYIPYKTDVIPSTKLGMGILSYLKYWEYTGKKDSLALQYAMRMAVFL